MERTTERTTHGADDGERTTVRLFAVITNILRAFRRTFRAVCSQASPGRDGTGRLRRPLARSLLGGTVRPRCPTDAGARDLALTGRRIRATRSPSLRSGQS